MKTMNIHSRKIEFIQAFLKLKDEEMISKLEGILREQNSEFKPMSLKEFNDRINKSENDFKNGNYKSTSELLNKYTNEL